MAKEIVINNAIYDDVSVIQVPLASNPETLVEYVDYDEVPTAQALKKVTYTENGTYKFKADSPNGYIYEVEATVNVPSSGSAKNVQGYHGMGTVKNASYVATGVALTVAKTGTYKVSWCGYRSTSSGTSGSQLYVGGAAYGSAYTTFTNTYGQTVTLTNVSLIAGQIVEVRARSRSTSYAMGVGNLIIEQTA